jgi:Nucleotidyltransferase domain
VLIIDEKTLKQVVERIEAATDSSRVIVFGSYGHGNAGEGSDLDFMGIKPEVSPADPDSGTVDSHSCGAADQILPLRPRN